MESFKRNTTQTKCGLKKAILEQFTTTSELSHKLKMPTLWEALVDHSDGFLFIDQVIPYIPVSNLLSEVYLVSKYFAKMVQRQIHHTIVISLDAIDQPKFGSPLSMIMYCRGIKIANTYRSEKVRSLARCLELNSRLDKYWQLDVEYDQRKSLVSMLVQNYSKVEVLNYSPYYREGSDCWKLLRTSVDKLLVSFRSYFLNESGMQALLKFVKDRRVSSVEITGKYYASAPYYFIRDLSWALQQQNVSANLNGFSLHACSIDQIRSVKDYFFKNACLRYEPNETYDNSSFTFTTNELRVEHYNSDLHYMANVKGCTKVMLFGVSDSFFASTHFFNKLIHPNILTELNFSYCKISVDKNLKLIQLLGLTSLNFYNSKVWIGQVLDPCSFIELFDTPKIETLECRAMEMDKIPIIKHSTSLLRLFMYNNLLSDANFDAIHLLNAYKSVNHCILQGNKFTKFATVQPLLIHIKKVNLTGNPFQDILFEEDNSVRVLSEEIFFTTKRVNRIEGLATASTVLKALREVFFENRNVFNHEILPKMHHKKSRNLSWRDDNILFWNDLLFNKNGSVVDPIGAISQVMIHLSEEMALKYGKTWIFFGVFGTRMKVLDEALIINKMEIVKTWRCLSKQERSVRELLRAFE